MKQTLIIITTVVLATAAVDAQAEKRRGFVAFINAVAEARAIAREQRANADSAGYYDSYDAGYETAQSADYGPEIVDLRGSWVMRDGKVNRFQLTHDGYYVAPVGRGRGVHYVEIGDNLYQDANSSGTYEVLDYDYMVWRSNDRRNLVIELFRQ